MKKIFSFAIVLAAVAMISCGGNATKPAAEATEAPKTETACPECTKCDSTKKAECAQCDSTKKAECCAKCDSAKKAECCKK
ncbi:MAG: hypothetical protein E7148_03010 [Rikenellaceae bacterium]|nr:hypothetical protein [Rikenellaceae bacterium]